MSAAADVDEVERLARVKLSCGIEPGTPRVTALVSALDAGVVLDYLAEVAEVDGHWASSIGKHLAPVDPARVLEDAGRQGIRFLVPGDAEWPDQVGSLRDTGVLHDVGGEPVGLWVRGAGDLRQVAAASVAVAGSRAATSYGLEVASDLGRDLASMGKAVISGAAYGIDQAALRGALLAGGTGIAVLSCGADRAHPAAHAELLDTIAQRGGLVVSECPPGTSPTRARFLARNRITAALAEGTVVVEGAVRSGAMDTAHWTRNVHRPVMGMPGPVTSVASAGVHQLIRRGEASMVTNAQEVLADITTVVAAAARSATVDESYIPGPVCRTQSPVGAAASSTVRSAPGR